MPLRTELDLGPGDIVLDDDPAPPKGAEPPKFRPMSIVAKRSRISATADHLSSGPAVSHTRKRSLRIFEAGFTGCRVTANVERQTS